MKISKHILLIFIFFHAITTHAQKVSNITYRQEQSNIFVSYDLETKTPCKVSLHVSTNDGTSWQGPLTKVTGDVGDKITSGGHNITWNVLEEFDELRGDNIKFQVRAVGDNIETVMIGTQEWTTKNLDVSKFRNGDIIPATWYCYNKEEKNEAIYGKLYNWRAVNDPRGLSPEGFHIPSKTEWDILISKLGGISEAGGKMKTTGITRWKTPNGNATNDSGFSGLPGGNRDTVGSFNNTIGLNGVWWSSTENDKANPWALALNGDDGTVQVGYFYKDNFFSVRCLRD